MDKNRTKLICMQMVEKLDCIINELDKKTPYYGYMDEKLRAVENDIKCVREEINLSKQLKGTAKDFSKYILIQNIGIYNMLDSRAEKATGLPHDIYMNIY